MANVASIDGAKAGPMTGEEKKVIFASSLGTVFEWYDFYLYGSLATYIGATYFTQYPEATRNIFTLLAFAAGFLVRPFGALVFGRLGDLVGRKYTFLVTIMRRRSNLRRDTRTGMRFWPKRRRKEKWRSSSILSGFNRAPVSSFPTEPLISLPIRKTGEAGQTSAAFSAPAI